MSLAGLAQVSARVGADPLLVQGPGGNSSLKVGDELWVKASGVWLAEALARPVFAGLSLGAVRAAIARGETEGFGKARLPGSDPALRPSIETALHALMPQLCVLHAHAVNSMAVTVLGDGQRRAAAALDGHLRWAWVPYRRPGAPLAEAIALVLAEKPDVLLLQNHGVVVGADSPEAAEARLREVEQRLQLRLRQDVAEVAGDGVEAQGEPHYEPCPGFGGIARDGGLTAALTSAPLFPDQVVFVGGAVPLVKPGETVAARAAEVEAATGVAPALMLVAGRGAVARRGRSGAADAVIAGLREVALRLPAGAAVVGLPQGAAAELLGWDAEAYRLKLAAERTA